MKLHCPHCGVKGSTDDSYSGRKVTCPECKELFVVSPDMVIVSPEAPEVAEVVEVLEENVATVDTYEEPIDTPVDEAQGDGVSDDETPEEPDLAESDEEPEEESEAEPEEEPNEEDREDDTVALEDEIEQEPYGIEKKQCWECGIEESSDESFITSNGRLYCTNCVQPESPDVASDVEEEPLETADEFEKNETHEAPENETHPEEPAKGGAWAKLKSFFKK